MGAGIGIIGWIIIGGLAGWLGSKIAGTDKQQGIFLNIIVGIIGAFIGGAVMRFFGANTAGGGWIFSLVTAIVGSVILLFVVKKVTK